MSELVTRRDDGNVAILTLNRPDQLNALSPRLFGELRAHVDALAQEGDRIGAVVLTGAGRSFSAGNDLKAIAAGETAPPHFQAETIERLEALPQVVVGAVRGHCYTGALELVLGCDLIVASEMARFCDTHGKFAMVPQWGMSVRLPARIGLPKAREIMFTGRVVDGREAERIGLANQCVADAALDQAALDLAKQVAANSPWTLRHEKALLARAGDLPRAQAIREEREKGVGRGPDSAARVAAFARR